MIACFGTHDGYQLARFPRDRLIENVPRLDIWMLLRCGGLVPGTPTELAWDTGGCHCRASTGNVEVDGVPIPITWDTPMEGIDRPWWSCPLCSARCRFVHLRGGTIACRRCLGLQHASLHLRRQVRSVGRVKRLRSRLGNCELQPFAPLPTRIRRGRGGRSRAYHDALVAAILDEETKLLGHLQRVTRDLDRRIRVRKERGKW